MFGTTITVLDGYSRVLSESLQLLRTSKAKKYYLGILLLQALLAMLVVLFFKADLKKYVDVCNELSVCYHPSICLDEFGIGQR